MKKRPTTRSTADQQRPELSDDASGSEENYNATAELSTSSGAPARAPAAIAGAPVNVDTERLLTGVMESFARMQAETNRALVETLRSMSNDPRNTPPPPSTVTGRSATGAVPAPGGNFAKCTARFDGSSRDADVVEAFIDAVTVYKECSDVNDEHALRGLPMLLEGDAAVWWRGARDAVGTWPDALLRLRAMYGVQQPAYKVLRNIYAKEQSEDERAEVFICKVRSQLVKLPYSIPVQMQIDIIYGLLHRRVRKRLSRSDVSSVDSFVEEARVIEDAIDEVEVHTYPGASARVATSRDNNMSRSVHAPPENGSSDRCATTGPCVTTGAKLTVNSNEGSNRDKRVRCSFCKFYGHQSNDCRNRAAKSNSNAANSESKNATSGTNHIRCYGCGQPGVVRSRCETCRLKNAPVKSVEFNTVSDGDDASERTPYITTSSHPTVTVTIGGRVGVAVIDTGASCSIAIC